MTSPALNRIVNAIVLPLTLAATAAPSRSQLPGSALRIPHDVASVRVVTEVRQGDRVVSRTVKTFVPPRRALASGPDHAVRLAPVRAEDSAVAHEATPAVWRPDGGRTEGSDVRTAAASEQDGDLWRKMREKGYRVGETDEKPAPAARPGLREVPAPPGAPTPPSPRQDEPRTPHEELRARIAELCALGALPATPAGVQRIEVVGKASESWRAAMRSLAERLAAAPAEIEARPELKWDQIFEAMTAVCARGAVSLSTSAAALRTFAVSVRDEARKGAEDAAKLKSESSPGDVLVDPSRVLRFYEGARIKAVRLINLADELDGAARRLQADAERYQRHRAANQPARDYLVSFGGRLAEHLAPLNIVLEDQSAADSRPSSPPSRP